MLAVTAWMAVTPTSVVAADGEIDRFALAAQQYQERNWEQAAEHFAAAIDLTSDEATRREANFFLAESQMELRQFAEAATAFDTYLSLANDGATHWQRALFRAGEAHHLAGNREQADAALKRFLHDYPADSLAAYAHRYAGEAALIGSEVVAAASHFQAVVEQYATSPLAPLCHLKLAHCFELLDRSAAAREIYQRFYDDPELGAYCRQRVTQLDSATDVVSEMLSSGRTEEAEALLRKQEQEERAEPVDRSPQWMAVADVYPEGSAGNIRGLQAIVEGYPHGQLWPRAMLRMGRIEFESQEFAAAADRCALVLGHSPPAELIPHALFLLGQVQASQGDWTAAGESMRRLIHEFPADPLAPAATYWFAEAEFRLQQWRSARDQLCVALQDNDGSASPWAGIADLRLAQVDAHLGEWQAALERAAGIRERHPDFAQQFEADYLIGRAHASLGEFEQAREAYQRALDAPRAAGTETAAMAQWMIGESYLHEQRPQDALAAYLRVESQHDWPEWQAAGLFQAAKCYDLLQRPRPASETRALLCERYGETSFAAEVCAMPSSPRPEGEQRVARQPASRPTAVGQP